MNLGKSFKFAAVAIAVLALAQIAQAQSDVKIANMTVGTGSVRWDVLVSGEGGSITIAFPDGRSFTKDFKGSSVQFDLMDKKFDGVPDGVYNWELRVSQSFTPPGQSFSPPGMGHANINARKDDEPEADRAGRKPTALPALVQSGTFAVVNGTVIGPGATEGGQDVARKTPPQQLKTQTATSPAVPGNTITRLRNHRFSLAMRPDIVDADDVIIQGSLCVGLDCVNNESFGFDTIRLKENNTRIKFEDTSTSAGFPSNDWQLTANDSGSGGANKFSIEDITGSKVPFTITAGAPTNSVFVDSTGRVGFRTSTPVLDLHVSTTNTPAIRQEQTSAGGFTAQTWDIGANEANWFVRDVTGGSRLPFRIRPGAPTSSIDISASGNVGIGTASPSSKLHVEGTAFINGNVGIGTSSPSQLLQINAAAATQAAESFSVSGTTFGIWGVAGGANNLIAGSVLGDSVVRGQGTNILFSTDSGASAQLYLKNGGNIGVGTTSPDQKLSVNGDADKVGGGSWLNFSDERLKRIKGNYQPGLQAVMQLTPIRYEYLKNNALGLKSEGEHIGFGAQTLQKVLPEAVVKNSEGYLMVNNDPIIWTMLNAIKEQQKEIEQLKSRIQNMRRSTHRRRK